MNDLARFALATRLYEAPKKNLDPKTLRAYIDAAEAEIMRLRILSGAKEVGSEAQRAYHRNYMRDYRRGRRRAQAPASASLELA